MELKEVKQQFFALRNGLLADTLRKQASLPHKLIFGLNIIQLRQMAAEIGKDSALAEALWADADCRESRLLAPMIQPVPQPTWFSEVRTPEEADILCHASLRFLPDALRLVRENALSSDPLIQYSALRLLMNLLSTNPELYTTAGELLDSISVFPLSFSIAAQIRQEIDFLES